MLHRTSTPGAHKLTRWLNLGPVVGGMLVGMLTFGATHLDGAFETMGPHPGLRDGALKDALKKAHTHKVVPYSDAKAAIFRSVDNRNGMVTERYMGISFKTKRAPLPHLAQIDHVIARTKLKDEATQSDLHGMFPVASEARLARNILPFCEVLLPAWEKGGSRAGVDKRGRPCFEPRADHKGDTARAMFYMSVMYGYEIPDAEETVLRKWHTLDRVDGRESARNTAVQAVQKSSNPFIEHPDLVERIADF